MRIHELGHVVLYVTDIERSVAFYRDILGFKLVEHDGGVAAFSSGRTHHELLLIEIGGHPRPAHRPEPGLYHIGFKIGDGPEVVREAYRELTAKGVTIIGATDHHVTHGLYVLDPDGNELELYADVSDDWKTDPTAMMRPPKALRLE